MKILGIESASLVASVAVVEEGKTLGEFTTDFQKTHSQTLLPMLEQLLNILNLELSDMAAIAVSKGPGSFTGLRIGGATAKGLAQAVNLPIVPVSTLEAMAMNLWGCQSYICPIMDARRSQVYTGVYENTQEFNICIPPMALSAEELFAHLSHLPDGRQRGIVFLGDGVPVYRASIEKNLQLPHFFAPENMNRQRAASVALRGRTLLKEGKGMAAGEFVPEYLRKSQAERERLAHEHQTQ